MGRHHRSVEDLDIKRPGLEEWIVEEDARLDEQRAAQERLIDRGRWEKTIAGLADAADIGSDPFMRDGIVGPLVDVMTDHAAGDFDAKAARRTRGRRARDPNVRFADEIEALRAWYTAQAESRSGDFDRIAQRIGLGATIQTSTRNHEPVPDPALAAIGRALDSLETADSELLEWVHVEFQPPTQRTGYDLMREDHERRVARWASMPEAERGPEPRYEVFMVPVHLLRDLSPPTSRHGSGRESDTQARERFEAFARWVRDGRKLREGEVTEELPGTLPVEIARPALSAMAMAQRKSLPPRSRLHADGLRWEHLVAERLGLNVSGALGPLDPRKVEGDEALLSDDERDERRMTWLEASAREVRARYQAARRRFREALLAVELDTRPKFLIPAPTTRELDADARGDAHVTVVCCGGIRVVDGLRLPCESVDVEGPSRRHPSSAWVRCSVCGAPVVPDEVERAPS